MRLVTKLVNSLYRAVSRDPKPELMLRLQFRGRMSWAVEDGVLITYTPDGVSSLGNSSAAPIPSMSGLFGWTAAFGDSGAAPLPSMSGLFSAADESVALSSASSAPPGLVVADTGLRVDLSKFTIGGLAAVVRGVPGYSVPYVSSAMAGLSAVVLIDGSGDLDALNGDQLKGFTALHWSYLDAVAAEVAAAKTQVSQMLSELDMSSAEGEWLDEFGDHFGVPRMASELDGPYGRRVVIEAIRPRVNNIAIEEAIKEAFGQVSTVVDVGHGLFNVVIGYDMLSGGDMSAYGASVRGLVNRFRAGGTQMGSLSLSSGQMSDAVTSLPVDEGLIQDVTITQSQGDAVSPSVDALSVLQIAPFYFADPVSVAADSITLSFSIGYTFNSTRTFNGAITYSSGSVVETF